MASRSNALETPICDLSPHTSAHTRRLVFMHFHSPADTCCDGPHWVTDPINTMGSNFVQYEPAWGSETKALEQGFYSQIQRKDVKRGEEI